MVEVDRGGDVTYHGPGQVVGYPILPLANWKKSAEWYMRMLESMLLNALEISWKIKGERVPGRSGVWVASHGDPLRKVAAIGVAFRRWITYHGFALNIAKNMPHFDLIVPCGIAEAGIVGVSEIAGRTVSFEEASEAVIEAFADSFSSNLV